MTKNIFFIDSNFNTSFGSSIIRRVQLNHIFSCFNKNTNIKSHLSTNSNFKNSILIFTKHATIELTDDAINNLKNNGNILIADPVDGVIDDVFLSKFDAIFACSVLQKINYQSKFNNRIHYIGHHVDIRIEIAKPKLDFLKIGYFGELSNARFTDDLAREIDFINIDTSLGHDTDWMLSLKKYNAHYAIRSEILPNQFKPFTKGFIAAHMGCPILLSSDDLEAKYFVGDNYPYFANPHSASKVQETIERMRYDFGGENWNLAVKTMKKVKSLSTIKKIAQQLINAIEIEMTYLAP